MIDIEKIAAAIHETWRSRARTAGWSMRPHLDRPYADLSDVDKVENRAAAGRMEDVLAVGGFALAGDAARPYATAEALAATRERMAEAEHEGWMAHRARNGWTWGETRDEEAKRHPSMIPYAKLPEQEKDKDRGNVRDYPTFAARAGYRIVSRP